MFRPLLVGINRQGCLRANVHSLKVLAEVEDLLQGERVDALEQLLVLLKIVQVDGIPIKDLGQRKEGKALQQANRVGELRTFLPQEL